MGIHGKLSNDKTHRATAPRRELLEHLESRVLLSGTPILGQLPGSHLVIAEQPSNMTAGNALSSVVVQIEDGKGNVVSSDVDVTLSIGKGPKLAALGGDPTVAAVNGVATFSDLSLLQAGKYTLAATSGNFVAHSKNFTVSPGAASMLAFTEQPFDGTVRTTLGPVTVAVEDAFGNVVTTDGSKVALALGTDSSGASLGGPTIMIAKKGLAVFKNVTLGTPGSYSLTASDGALNGAVSNTFVLSGAATQLVFTESPRTALGQTPISAQVTLEDSAGNVVTKDNSKVTLKIASGPAGAKLMGTVTVSAHNGVATFSGLTLKEGDYQLMATDGKLTSAPTGDFSMTAGPAVKLRILSVVTTGTAKGPFVEGQVGPITVAVEDALGNLVTTDTSTVTLALNTTLDTEPTIGTVTQAQTATATVAGGIATFTGLTTEPIGWYQVVLTDGSLASTPQLLFVR